MVKRLCEYRLCNLIFLALLIIFNTNSTICQTKLSWKIFGHLEFPRQRFEIAPISQNKVIVAGGYTMNNIVTNKCEIIDVERSAVYPAKEMLEARTEFVCITNKNSEIIVIGGFNGTNTVRSIERYNQPNNTWKRIGFLLVGRRQHVAAMIDDSLLIIVGGRDSLENTLSSAEIFNIHTGKSKFVSPLPFQLSNSNLQIDSHGNIIVFTGRTGGHTSLQPKDVLRYEPLKNEWICTDSIPKSSSTVAATKLLNGSVIFSGGMNQKANSNHYLSQIVLEIQGHFIEIGNMEHGRNAHWMVQFDENTVISGGGFNHQNSRPTKTTDIFNFNEKKQNIGPEMIHARALSKAISVPIMKDGKVIKPRVLVISGVDDKFLSSIEILDETPQISGIINTYTAVTQILGKYSSQVNVKSTDGFSVGDKVLIMQMQGAQTHFSTLNQAEQKLNYNNSGNHEFARITNISGNVIAFEKQLTLPYSVSGKVQLIRVPEYGDVVVNGTLTCKPWDGEKGGVLAFKAYGTITMDANIEVNGKGFNGGKQSVSQQEASVLFLDNQSMTHSPASDDVVTLTMGEGITSDEQSRRRETIGNGGGAGLNNNAGGAGGANISCGGQGGAGWVSEFSISDNMASKGGIPLEYNGKRVFMGGGGGAGHTNATDASQGGNGGGIVFVSAKRLFTHNYSISANGVNGTESSASGAGGAGAGGCVYLDIEELNQELYVYANGGNGGNNVISESEESTAGSGGGGGGGVVLLSKPNNGSIIAYTNGGSNGVSASVFHQNMVQGGCHGIVIENVKVIDASENTNANNRFIKDCLNDDCSEYVQSEHIQTGDALDKDELQNNQHENVNNFLYPNPASDILTVSTSNPSTLDIFDSMGTIHHVSFTENHLSATFNVSSLQNGVYFIRDNQRTLPFVIKR